jgi:hypothetical protein
MNNNNESDQNKANVDKKFDSNVVDTIIAERFSVLENYFFDTHFYARRFEDLAEYLDYYIFYEERQETIVKSEHILIDFDDYLAFTRNLFHIIDFSFETKHVLLQQNGTQNTSVVIVGDELGVKMSMLCFYKLHALFVKERARYIDSLPHQTKSKNKTIKGREYIEECVEEFKSYVYLYPLPEAWGQMLKTYIKKNFLHEDEYYKAARVLARFTLNVMEAMKTVKAEEFTEEFIQKLRPSNLDSCTEMVEQNQDSYIAIKLASKWRYNFDRG